MIYLQYFSSAGKGSLPVWVRSVKIKVSNSFLNRFSNYPLYLAPSNPIYRGLEFSKFLHISRVMQCKAGHSLSFSLAILSFCFLWSSKFVTTSHLFYISLYFLCHFNCPYILFLLWKKITLHLFPWEIRRKLCWLYLCSYV